MSISAVVLEGARRAALYAALLFTFDAATPAVAQAQATSHSPAAQSAAPLAIDGSVADSGLTLAAHHVDVHVAGETATVRTRLLLRNDTAGDVAAQYTLPYPARLARGDAWLAGALSDDRCGDGDLSPAAAEYAEAADAPAPLAQRHDVIVVAAGSEITLEVEREMPIVTAGSVHRLRLPLPVDRDAPWVPRFTADVLVEADAPIRRLSSPTHEALVDGIGGRAALLSVDGFVYRQQELAVEFELEAPASGTPVLALDHAPARPLR
jgi:hypothetical protein